MNDALTSLQSLIVNISTPYNEGGIGLMLPLERIILTNEHVVRDNFSVIIQGYYFPTQSAEVIYLDARNDMAFIALPMNIERIDLPTVKWRTTFEIEEPILVWNAQNYSDAQIPYSTIVQQLNDEQEVSLVIYEKAEGTIAGNGFLIDQQYHLLGMKKLVPFLHHPNWGTALTSQFLQQTIQLFRQSKAKATRCEQCMNIVFESDEQQQQCPNCGTYLVLPSAILPYEPQGVAQTIEQIIKEADYDVRLSRRGIDKWEIVQGSAKIIITHHENSGLIMGDAYLCQLPDENKLSIYEFLLTQNTKLEGLTFSVKPKSSEIVLSLLIYEQYLNVPTGIALFQHLLETADFFDNILVEKYGATWQKTKKFQKESQS